MAHRKPDWTRPPGITPPQGHVTLPRSRLRLCRLPSSALRLLLAVEICAAAVWHDERERIEREYCDARSCSYSCTAICSLQAHVTAICFVAEKKLGRRLRACSFAAGGILSR